MKRYQSRARSFSSFMNSVLSGSMRRRLLACSLLLAAIALPQFSAPRAVAEEVPFSMLNMIDPNFDRARIVHGADFDGDGDQDILAVAHDADEVVWYENLLADGSSWTKHIIDGSIDGPMDAIAVDLDKDGDLDVLGASRLGNYVTWWENTNADGSAWTEHLLVSNFMAAWTTRAVDMDRDGDPDVLATAFTSDDVIWMENTNGDASAWTRHNIDLNLDGADCAHAGDLDGDGDIDVAASGYTFSLGDVAWYENMDGSGTVWTKHLLDATIDGAHGANIGDMDGDGNLDILAVSNRDGYLAWWENANGDGSVWTKRTVISGISRPHFAQPADFDGDGDHDILTNARFSNDFFWMENVNGDGLTWTRRNIELNFSEASFADFADIDGDGDLDVVGTAELGDDVAWWENLWLGRRPGIISIIPETTGPTNASTLNFTATFDRIVTDFDDQADVTFDHNGTAHTDVTFTALPGNKIYNVAVNGITGDGLFTLSINPSSALNTNGLGNTAGGPSADVWIDTTAPDAPISAPTDAGSFVLSATTNFSWTGSSDPGFASSGIAFYQIQVGTSPGASDVLDTTTLASVRTQSVTGTLGATLFARVRAIDAAGNIGPWSADSDGIYLDAAGLSVRIAGEIRSFLVDPGVVRSLAFSPDNTKILTAGSNNWAILWDDATGDQITTFTGHTKSLMDAVFSPDGTKVLTGSNDGKAKIWNTATGTLIRTFSVNSNGVTDVAYSPDGTKILAGGYGNQAVLFDVATGAIIHVFSGNNSWVRSVAFSPDGTQVLTGGQGDVAILWNATTGALIRTFTGHTDGIWTVDFSPDGTKILTGSRDGTAKIWNAATGAVIRTFPGSTTEVRKAIFSPDGTSVLTGTLGDGAKLWDVATGAEIHTFSELSSMAFSVDISSDGTRILVGFSDGTVFQYYMNGGFGDISGWTNDTTIDAHLSGRSYTPLYVEMDEDPAFGSPTRVAYSGSSLPYTFDNDTNETKTLYVRLANDTGEGQAVSVDIGLDTVAPSAPDAPIDEGDFSLDPTVGFSWTASSDPGAFSSGLVAYDCEVGTAPGASDILAQSVDSATLAQIATGSLGDTAFARVRAVDAAGNVSPWSADSDGIYLDAAGLTVTLSDPDVVVGAGSFVEVDKLVGSNAGAGDNFGYSISIDGDTMVAGSRYDEVGVANAGAAYVYDKIGGVWVETSILTASDGQALDFFGFDVEISGNTIVAGAFYEDTDGTDAGAAYVFEKSGGIWTQTAKLLASDGAAGNHFGQSTSIDNDTIAVGASMDNPKGVNSGSVYIFEKVGGVWTQITKLVPSDSTSFDHIGVGVAIKGDTLMLGCELDDVKGTDSGSVYVYERSDGLWSQTGKILASDGASGDAFSSYLNFDGSTLVVTSKDDDKGVDSGSVYVFEKVGAAWTQVQKLTASDGTAGDAFGQYLAVFGDTIAIGAVVDDDNGSDSGSAYLYERIGGVWTETLKLIASDGAAGDYFGYGIAINTDSLLVGAFKDNSLSGSIYEFAVPTGNPEWTNDTTIDVELSGLPYTPQYVEMDEDPAFGSPTRVAYSGSSLPYTFDNDTNETKTLYVRLANDTGAGQAASDDIGLDTVAPAAPDAPIDEGDFSLDPTVGFSWTASSDPGAFSSGLVAYDCEVGTAPGASDILAQTTDSATTLAQVVTGAEGDTLFARVCAIDAAGNVGEWSGDSDGIFIDTPPGVPIVLINPTTPRTLDRIIPGVYALDPDPRDTVVSYRFEWLLDDVVKSSETVLMGDLTSKKEQWICRAWAQDSYGAWGDSGETSFTIQNSPPTQPFVMIKPQTPRPDEDLIIDILVYSTDPDGDEIGYDFQWYKSLDGGNNWIRKVELDGSSQVSSQYINLGELWRVLYIPYEKNGAQRRAARGAAAAMGGRVEGIAGWDQVYIGDNTPPTFSFQTLQSMVWSDDEVKLDINWQAADADGDAVTFDIYWTDFVNSGLISLGQGIPIAPSKLSAMAEGMPHDLRPVYLHVVATDSKGAVTQITSDALDFIFPNPTGIKGTWMLYR